MPKPTATGSPILADDASSVETGLPLTTALEDWRLYLDGEVKRRRKSPATRDIYVAGATRFVRFATDAGMPPSVEGIRREHIEAFLVHLAEGGSKAATMDTYRRGVSRWFAWLVEDDVIEASPSTNVKAIPIPETPPPVLRPEHLRAIFAAAKPRDSKDFEGYRDTALIWLLLCGLRRGELAGIKVAHVERQLRRVIVTGKGNRTRVVPFLAPEVDKAVRQYERARDKHHARGLEWYFVGWKGRLSGDGIRQAVERRAKQAGVEGVYAHLFRHSAAHASLAAGMQEGDLMQIFGWRSSSMARRYGASAASERAQAAASRLDIYPDVS